MDHQSLKTTSNGDSWKENKAVRHNLKVPASKKEELIKSRSEIIQKLIRDKEREKDEARRREQEKAEREVKKKNSFRIPKKKQEDVNKLINSLFDDTGTLEMEDSPCVPNSKQENSSHYKSSSSVSLGHKEKHISSSHQCSATGKLSYGGSSDQHSSSSSHQYQHKSHSQLESSSSSSGKLQDSRSGTSSAFRSSSTFNDDKHKTSSSTSSDHKHKTSSSTSSDHKHKTSSTSSDYKHKTSSSTSNDHKHKTSSSTSYDHKHKTSSSTSSDHKHKTSSSTSSDHKHKTSSSTSNDHKHKTSSSVPSDQKHSSQSNSSMNTDLPVKSSSSKDHSSLSSKPKEPQSSSKCDTKPSSSSPSKNAVSPRSSGSQLTVSEQQPVVLNKHHLNPTMERQASSGLSEKEMILARLQAIKQRTLEAIHKENSAKGRRMKGEKSHRKSKSEVKHDDKTKSAETVRDNISSDEEDHVNNGVPSALDIMLSERNAKLEKEKIARLAKQAWERATKKDTADPDKEIKVKKKHKSSRQEETSTHKHGKSSNDHRKNKHKGIDGSLSQNHDSKKFPAKPKKPVIVRHSVQAPPPMDFKTLLEMAEKKQKEPSKPAAAIPKKKKEVDERPLTQEEKDRRARVKTKEYQDWLKLGGKPPSKQDGTSDDDELQAPSSHNNVDKRQLSSDRQKVPPNSSKQTADSDRTRHKPPSTASGDKLRNITVHENVLVCGPAASTDDERSPDRQENPFDRIMNKIHKKRPPSKAILAVPSKKNRLEDSEAEDNEEYDSEMDDFIDDGDDVEPDYSREIKKLFGYDKSKYKYEREDDLSDMEADFSTVMKEEKRSARLGLLEDLEDMKREQEELKRKAKMKKMK